MSDKTPSATTYALLGLLDARSWTGYELTNQLRRSLRFIWPSSEGHLYREQKRLVELGWATVTQERPGKRLRKRYAITPEGRAAMSDWLRTEPSEPRLEIEGLVRMFYGNQGTVEDLVHSMESTSRMTRSMLDSLFGFVDEYLEAGGPMSMLERGVGGPEDERLLFHGRPQFPERLHVVALVLDVATEVLAALDSALGEAAEEARQWPSPTDVRITPLTRTRLQKVRARAKHTDLSA